MLVYKFFNPYHDNKGRFTTGPGGRRASLNREARRAMGDRRSSRQGRRVSSSSSYYDDEQGYAPDYSYDSRDPAYMPPRQELGWGEPAPQIPRNNYEEIYDQEDINEYNQYHANVHKKSKGNGLKLAMLLGTAGALGLGAWALKAKMDKGEIPQLKAWMDTATNSDLSIVDRFKELLGLSKDSTKVEAEAKAPEIQEAEKKEEEAKAEGEQKQEEQKTEDKGTTPPATTPAPPTTPSAPTTPPGTTAIDWVRPELTAIPTDKNIGPLKHHKITTPDGVSPLVKKTLGDTLIALTGIAAADRINVQFKTFAPKYMGNVDNDTAKSVFDILKNNNIIIPKGASGPVNTDEVYPSGKANAPSNKDIANSQLTARQKQVRDIVKQQKDENALEKFTKDNPKIGGPITTGKPSGARNTPGISSISMPLVLSAPVPGGDKPFQYIGRMVDVRHGGSGGDKFVTSLDKVPEGAVDIVHTLAQRVGIVTSAEKVVNADGSVKTVIVVNPNLAPEPQKAKILLNEALVKANIELVPPTIIAKNSEGKNVAVPNPAYGKEGPYRFDGDPNNRTNERYVLELDTSVKDGEVTSPQMMAHVAQIREGNAETFPGKAGALAKAKQSPLCYAEKLYWSKLEGTIKDLTADKKAIDIKRSEGIPDDKVASKMEFPTEQRPLGTSKDQSKLVSQALLQVSGGALTVTPKNDEVKTIEQVKYRTLIYSDGGRTREELVPATAVQTILELEKANLRVVPGSARFSSSYASTEVEKANANDDKIIVSLGHITDSETRKALAAHLILSAQHAGGTASRYVDNLGQTKAYYDAENKTKYSHCIEIQMPRRFLVAPPEHVQALQANLTYRAELKQYEAAKKEYDKAKKVAEENNTPFTEIAPEEPKKPDLIKDGIPPSTFGDFTGMATTNHWEAFRTAATQNRSFNAQRFVVEKIKEIKDSDQYREMVQKGKERQKEVKVGEGLRSEKFKPYSSNKKAYVKDRGNVRKPKTVITGPEGFSPSLGLVHTDPKAVLEHVTTRIASTLRPKSEPEYLEKGPNGGAYKIGEVYRVEYNQDKNHVYIVAYDKTIGKVDLSAAGNDIEAQDKLLAQLSEQANTYKKVLEKYKNNDELADELITAIKETKFDLPKYKSVNDYDKDLAQRDGGNYPLVPILDTIEKRAREAYQKENPKASRDDIDLAGMHARVAFIDRIGSSLHDKSGLNGSNLKTSSLLQIMPFTAVEDMPEDDNFDTTYISHNLKSKEWEMTTIYGITLGTLAQNIGKDPEKDPVVPVDAANLDDLHKKIKDKIVKKAKNKENQKESVNLSESLWGWRRVSRNGEIRLLSEVIRGMFIGIR